MLQPARQSLSCCSRASSPGAPRQPRGKPWPRARSLVGRLRHGWGKPLAGWGEWERDMGISDPAAVLGDSTAVEEPPGEPPGSCRSQAGDGGGGALPWGSQVLWQGLGAPWPWARPSLGAALAATRTRLCWRWPKAVGGQRGAWPRAGGSGKAPSHRLPARAMTHAGQGELGEEAAASWARCRLQRRPREPSGMRWHSSRFPRRPWCRKYTRSWWRLPQRWARCHAVEGGTTPDPGVPARDPGAGRWELRGVVEPGAGRDQRLLPRLPLPPPAFDVPGLRPW